MSEHEHKPGGGDAHQHDEKAHEFFSAGDKGHLFDDKEMAEAIKKRPKSRRSTVVMVAVIAMALWVLWSMRPDIVYFFRSPEPRILGSVEEIREANLKSNTYVVLRGVPDPRKAQIELTNFGVLTTAYLYYPYLGNTSIIAREQIRELDLMQGPKDEYDATPRAGRLWSFQEFPRQSELKRVLDYYHERFDRSFDRNSWVLIAGEKPWSSFHVPFFCLVLLGFVAYNCWQLYRRFFER